MLILCLNFGKKRVVCVQDRPQHIKVKLSAAGLGTAVYTELKRVGRGAFGEAFLVRCHADGQEYCAKKMQIEYMSPDGREMCI